MSAGGDPNGGFLSYGIKVYVIIKRQL